MKSPEELRALAIAAHNRVVAVIQTRDPKLIQEAAVKELEAKYHEGLADAVGAIAALEARCLVASDD